MSELSAVLSEVRKTILRYQGKEMNEQNTKTALIDPVLRALGWNVGDLEEVQQEYKRRPKDKPVDYALLVLRTPRLFVEAKALGQDLNDRRWAHQVMGYATVAGVEWVVITNGDEYRIYNACAPIPVEEKLFRAVRVTDETAAVADTLRLLSKERISEKQIEILWQAHFVDRQVRAALEELFSAGPDPSLVKLIHKHLQELTPKDIKASLGRVQASFDFPVARETETPRATRRSTAARKAWATRRKAMDSAEGSPQPPAGLREVSLVDVIARGLLKPPLKLTAHYLGRDFEATLLPDGHVEFQGKRYSSCSKAASVARSLVKGRLLPINGWQFWRFANEVGEAVSLLTTKRAYLRQSTG